MAAIISIAVCSCCMHEAHDDEDCSQCQPQAPAEPELPLDAIRGVLKFLTDHWGKNVEALSDGYKKDVAPFVKWARKVLS